MEVRLGKRTDNCDVPCHGLALCHGTTVRPLGHLPAVRSVGSIEASMLAEDNE